MSVRLRVVNRKITEAESIVDRNVSPERNLANLKAPPPGFTDFLSPSERMTRAEMLRMPDIYFKALATLDASAIPWDDNSFRIENGMVTCGTIPGATPPAAGMPARHACRSPDGKVPPMLKTIYNVRPRRTPVVDVERGLTWGLYCFNHRGLATITMPDGSVQPSYSPTPNTMPFADMFKTRGGKLMGIFAIGTRMPYGIGDGWSGPMFQ